MSQDQKIADGQRVAAFMADDAVKQAFDRLEKRYVDEFAANDGTGLVAIHARAKALIELKAELEQVVSAGTYEATVKRREDAKPKPIQRPR